MGINIDIDQELLASFVDDAAEALQTFERSVLALRSDERDEALQDLFRTAHNLKGASMCIGFESFGDFIHSVEDVIQCIINGSVETDEKVVSTLLAAHGCMNTWVRTLISNPSFTPVMGTILKDLRAIGKGTSSSTHEAVAPSAPSPAAAEPDDSGEEEDLEALFQMHRKIYEEERKAKADAPPPPKAEIRDATPAGVPSSDEKPRSKAAQGSQAARSHETLRISAHKLDELIQLISELSIHQGIVQEARKHEDAISKSTARALQLSHKLVKDIHSKALELRMQPLTGLMQKLERNVIDLANMQGKQIRVVIEGSDVQLDKTIIEKISDPLVHVIRNSVDHGVEPPSRRVAQGKPAEATIKISAIQDAIGVSIVVADDGKGMDDQVIFAAAVKKGLVSADAQLTSDQIRRLIFVQGVSTASKLTEISGRGVGMDIVLRTVQSLRGRIDIESELGKGTAIAMTIPTSLSIIDALVVKVHDSRYAVPMHELTEIIDLSRYPIETTGKGGFMISLRGEVVPVETLADYMPNPGFLYSSPHMVDSKGRFGCPALLVRDGPQSIAFAIDKVVSQQQVVVRPLSDHLDGLQGFRGCTILGDGEPGVILSLPELAKTYFTAVGGGGPVT
jgi:two-component system chemotaxis sensor kinase CheA